MKRWTSLDLFMLIWDLSGDLIQDWEGLLVLNWSLLLPLRWTEAEMLPERKTKTLCGQSCC